MIEIDRLIALALDELPDTEISAVEEHLLACSRCANTFEQLLALGSGVRELVGAGKVRFAMSAQTIERLTAAGLISNVYRVPAGGSVNCSVGAGDIYTLAELSADLGTVSRVDAIVSVLGQSQRVADVPFDRARGTVAMVEPCDFLRMLPTTQYVIELVEGDTDRSIAKYYFNHSAG